MGLLDRLLGRSTPRTSSAVAKERLKLVLEYDRGQLSAETLSHIRDDIIASISRHVEVAPDSVDVRIDRTGRLVAEIPLASGAHRAAASVGTRAAAEEAEAPAGKPTEETAAE